MDYQEPSWAVSPPENTNWTLVEIKGGIQVAYYSLTENKCTVLGRAPCAQIPLQHESCSRVHARIAFDSHGIPWLRDLGSSHGTTVNRKPLPQAACGKVESNSTKRGSRGVIVYPGDVLQFGASTRMYCLEGPSEYERGAAIRVKKQPPKNNKDTDETDVLDTNTNKTDKDTECSWGMADSPQEENAPSDGGQDTHTASSSSSSSSSLLDPSMIPEKHRKLYERLVAKQYKLQNVQVESDRIQNKGLEQLSQGQEAQLHKNEKRIQQLQQELQELQQELDKKLHPNHQKHSSQQQKHTQENNNDDDDDYDFYDRTKTKNDTFFQDGETEESLVQKWNDLWMEWKQCSASLLNARQRVDQLQRRMDTADPNDEESFFLQNDLDLQTDSLKKAEEQKDEITHHLCETERLLQVVNANVEFDRETGFIGDPACQEKKVLSTAVRDDDTTTMPPPVNPASPIAPPRQLSPAASMLPPPVPMPPPSMLPPPPKRARVMGPTMPPSSTLAVDEMEMPPPQKSRPPRAPPIGTLSVLAASSSSKRDGKEIQSSNKKNTNHSSFDAPDAKKDVWKAPEGQDGSGMTKLNEKFAGRY